MSSSTGTSLDSNQSFKTNSGALIIGVIYEVQMYVWSSTYPWIVKRSLELK